MSRTVSFHPAPRPIWVLFSDEESVTFAPMPGWATVEVDGGYRWTALTWQNLHNFEANTLDAEDHTLVRMWDSGVHDKPTLENALDALRAQHRGATAEELDAVEADYRMCFNMPRASLGDTA